MTSGQLDICIVGMGPRGLSVLERICASAQEAGTGTRVNVHVVEPFPPGAGKVWRTSQPDDLLMNTVSSQVTLFTDDSVDLDGPMFLGPSLYEWARFMVLMGPFEDRLYPERVLEEAMQLGPDSYPTRAFYGHYLEWVFDRVVATAPDQVDIQVHRTKVAALDDDPGPDQGTQRVTFADGTSLVGLDAVILALGHLPATSNRRETELASFARARGLVYIAPANPADVDLSAVLPQQSVVLLGLGLNFFDYVALLTGGRGGRFAWHGDGRLVYHPSGREPRLYAGSRRGVPFHSRGENQKGPHGRHTPLVLVPEVVESLRSESARRGGLDFRRELWPLIAKEVETVYYTALLTATDREGEAAGFQTEYLSALWDSPEETRLLDGLGIAVEQRWDWERVSRPQGSRPFTGPADFQDWLLGYLADDASEARAGNVAGPQTAALDVLRDLRNEVRQLVDHSGLTGGSHREDLDHWYTPLNAFLSIGPPASRIEEAAALISAGVLTVLGPQARARADAQAGLFVAESPLVPGSEVSVAVLIDARLPDVDLRRTADPLLKYLLATGQCQPHLITDPVGDSYETGGLAVTARPNHLINSRGCSHPQRYAFGVPTEAVHWVTAAGIRPGVNSVTLTDADAIARAALDLDGASGTQPVGERSAAWSGSRPAAKARP